ncbi:MAG: transposase [Deltaproteobacteria bacterium]|nr:transposase [Deltaproteobacteria bacterium]
MSNAATRSCAYQRRRPELTHCFQIIAGHLNTFISEREAEQRPLPDYVVKEFEAYLKCGILAHGFIRLKCTTCCDEKIVAFSCKKRGFFPSCCAKRMAEAATHLTQNVLPLVPYRQFVVSFPIPLRYWLHTNKRFASEVFGLVTREIHRHYLHEAHDAGIVDATPGTICFTQRWGSALNLNPHIHLLCIDGVYTRYGDVARFRNLEPISDEEVASLVESIANLVRSLGIKRGYLGKDGDIVLNPTLDPLFQDHESLTAALAASISGKIAFGPNAGSYVRKIGGGFGYEGEVPLAKGKRCYSVNGFSLHTNTAVNTHARDRLYKLIEYIARGPLSNDRLEIIANGDVKLALKTLWSNGTTHLVFTPTEFIEKLVALTPPPRSHLVRWSGVFAPNSPYRKDVTLRPEIKKGFQFGDDATEGEKKGEFKNYTWSKMLAQVFKIDVTTCPQCGGDLAKVCAITDPMEARRYLKHLGLDYEPPPRAPPRHEQGEFHFESDDWSREHLS